MQAFQNFLSSESIRKSFIAKCAYAYKEFVLVSQWIREAIKKHLNLIHQIYLL